ncbi:MAG: DUF3971 domain-containing protein, partial [Halieaceae bacterium]|nr:DUF3971 domain-containing protein [Halieaceae bacterium]
MLLIVLLAMYSSLGRLLLGNLSQYQPQLISALNSRLNLNLEVDSLSGSWRSLSPSIIATGVRLAGTETIPTGLAFERLALEIDVFDSLRSLSPRLFLLSATGGELHLEVDAQGGISLAGLPQTGAGANVDMLLDFLFNAEAIAIDQTAVTLHHPDVNRQSFIEGRLERDGEFRRARLTVQAPARKSVFRLTGEGRGRSRDIDSFTGMIHLQGRIGDISLYRDLASLADMDPHAGAVNSELWLALDQGRLRVAADLDGTGIALSRTGPQPRDVNLDAFSVTAVTEQRDGRWNFRARDLTLSRGDGSVTIERLAGSFGDDALSLRLADLELGTLAGYLRRAGLLPETLEDVLGRLSPTGKVATAEFSLAGLAGPRDWQLAMNFSELDVKPWRGAPGLKSASGYALLSAERGLVQLSSSDFSMAFPKVFKQPLAYSAMTGELAWDIDNEAFRLRSGPFKAVAEEGDICGLFSLKIPRVEMPAGAEMDLLVSIRNSETRFRDKYLTYKLNPDLLDWLEDGVDAGHIQEAGFIYRGALIERPEHRSVQLFLDVDDTRIDYHPQWPAAEDFAGLILVDNAEVDAFGSARILSSRVSDAHIALRPNPDNSLRLFLRANMAGSAQDGLDIVNQSPLRERVGDSFSDWVLQGELASRLSLEMDLRNTGLEPHVELLTDWREVDVVMTNVDLTLEQVTGELRYNTGEGFTATSIAGSLWNENFTGVVSQGRSGDSLNALDIALRGPVSAESVRGWLELPALALAQGRTDAELHIRVPADEADGGPRLLVSSQLQGISLDLPPPWGKPADTARSLRVSFPLAPGARRVSVDLASQLYLDLDLDDAGLTGGNLGFGRLVGPGDRGRFWIGGDVGKLDWAVWESFLDRYFPEDSDGTVLGGIRDLQVAELVLFDRHVQDVSLGGLQSPDDWQIDFDTDWVAGSVTLPDPLDRIDLDLSRLDMQGLDRILASDPGFSSDAALPVTQIRIEQLYDGDALWGNVSFGLREAGANLHFEGIRGELRHLILGADGEEGMRLDWLGGTADGGSAERT